MSEKQINYFLSVCLFLTIVTLSGLIVFTVSNPLHIPRLSRSNPNSAAITTLNFLFLGCLLALYFFATTLARSLLLGSFRLMSLPQNLVVALLSEGIFMGLSWAGLEAVLPRQVLLAPLFGPAALEGFIAWRLSPSYALPHSLATLLIAGATLSMTFLAIVLMQQQFWAWA